MSNREILFRGKPKDDSHYYFFKQCWKKYCKNGFVYGSLVVSNDTPARYFISVSAQCNRSFCVNNGLTSMIEVIPETVGQFTNVYDVNGVQIFKGDIVEFYFWDKTKRNGELVDVKNTSTEVIEWSDSSFYMRELFRDYRLDENLNVITAKNYAHRGTLSRGVYKCNTIYSVEVIGNIHDNPELLEESEQE